ncbi:MAG: hypothetical protein PHE09_11075 [Oscillospiraceae bacterium]|nr:hypothetical protein [Oscillospiraceae bacterium]
MEDKIVEVVEKVGFFKKHAKGVKRGLIVSGALAGLAVIGAVINNKRSSDESEMWSEDADREQFEADYPAENSGE